MVEVAERPTYLTQAVKKLVASLGDNLVGVVLYGSYARGEANEDSDVDLLVIARDLPERRYERSVFFQRNIQGIENAPDFSVLGKTPEEFESYFPALYLDIGQDGIVLHDHDQYVAGKLKRIREIISQCGLVRERLDRHNMFWGWEHPVRRSWEITWEGFHEIA